MLTGTLKVHPILDNRVSLPMVELPVRAGFPSPADDYLESPLDLTEMLIQNKAATFMVRVAGDSMSGAGIAPDDYLVVDKSAEARDGSIVIASVNGEFTLKRLRYRGGVAQLVAENPAYPPLTFHDGDEMSIWGVVKHVIKSF